MFPSHRKTAEKAGKWFIRMWCQQACWLCSFLDKNWCKALQNQPATGGKTSQPGTGFCKGLSMKSILLILPGPLFDKADKGPFAPGGYGEVLLCLWQLQSLTAEQLHSQQCRLLGCPCQDLPWGHLFIYSKVLSNHNHRPCSPWPPLLPRKRCSSSLSVHNLKPPVEGKNSADPK